MPSEPWYEIVSADLSITQGDLVFNCPVLEWNPDKLNSQSADEVESLKVAADAISADVIVMTQACDLEQEKVSNVILCPHLPLQDHYPVWEDDMKSKGQNPNNRMWKKYCNDICNGFIWNLSMLNKDTDHDPPEIDIRVVDFLDVFTVPRSFLENLLLQRGKQRFRLLPPYREHLSQAFARFFMRVGLPVPIEKDWSIPQ